MITTIVENTFNNLLATDKQAAQRLAQFAGKSAGFDIKGTASPFIVKMTHHGIAITQGSLDDVDCVVRGTAIALFRYMNTKNVNPSTNAQLGIEVEGDLDFARRISKVVGDLNIDWAEFFSKVISDGPAHQSARLFSSLGEGFKKTKNAAKQNLHYIIIERVDQLVFRDEAEQFYQQIDQLVQDAQKLEKKINSPQ